MTNRAKLDDVRNGVSSLEDDTDYSSDEEEHTPEPDASSHDAFLFGYRSASLDLSTFHPPPAQMLRLWEIYRENVEETVKVIHVPTVDKLFQTLSRGGSVGLKEEPLVFTIYYAAIVSIEEDEVCNPPLSPLACR